MRCVDEDFIFGSIFHIYNHAIDGQLLFYDDQDYDFFQVSIDKQLEKIPASIIAYCLMPNHYHTLIKQDDDDKIYKIFNYAFISYARYYNTKYYRKGHIFRTPLQHKIVKDKTYLIQLCKYIHLNPVNAGLVELPEEWMFSNYRECINTKGKNYFNKVLREVSFPNGQDYASFVKSPDNNIREILIRNL
jgi:putative transposase